MNTAPKGNTQINVSQTVFNFLNKYKSPKEYQKILDLPCGEGEFASFLASTYKNTQVTGVELFSEPKNKNFNFVKSDALSFFEKNSTANFDAITCISGVMCFDGLDRLFLNFKNSLRPQGVLILSNDNFMTVRDRINFLFFGHFKRFKLIYQKNEGNWNMVSPQGILMHLQRNDFQFQEIKYTSVYFEDYLLAPLALIFYPIFLLKILTLKNPMSIKERLKLFPFLSLLARHYVVCAIRN